MIKIQGKLPRKIQVACSGGVDSMVVLDFLKNNHDVTVVHYHHGTSHADDAFAFVNRYCDKYNLRLLNNGIGNDTIPPGRSKEEWWREKRYEFFERLNDYPLITCHHLDDCVETWIFSSLNGTGKIVPYRRNHIIRPFRLNRKRDFELWANMKNVPYLEDDSNAELCYNRNYIRHKMMPHVLHVNPGIHKVVARKVKEDER